MKVLLSSRLYKLRLAHIKAAINMLKTVVTLNLHAIIIRGSVCEADTASNDVIGGIMKVLLSSHPY